MTQEDPTPMTQKVTLDSVRYALGRGKDAWPTLSRARREADEAIRAYEIIKAQVIYMELTDGASVREIAGDLEISKSEVGRITRAMRGRSADDSAPSMSKKTHREATSVDLLGKNRRLNRLNELWNGPNAEPLDLDEPQVVDPDRMRKIFAHSKMRLASSDGSDDEQ